MTADAAADLRPRFHVVLPRGFLNDPNGPIEIDGVAHLYFQSRPGLDLGLPVAWGHATSADYVRWQLQRPAMSPVPDGPDRDGCWSGNTVQDGEAIRAFYSGRVAGRPFQSVLTAVSTDGGRSFGPPVQIVPDPGPDEDAIMFRDPHVWSTADGWWMVVGAGYGDRGAGLPLYRSSDLTTWSAAGELAALPRTEMAGEDTGAAWECPQILTLEDRCLALVSSWSPREGPGEVLSFDVECAGQSCPMPIRVDHGDNFYAAAVQRDGRFGQLVYGWLTEGRDRAGWTDGRAGAISLPRTVWLGPDGSVRSAPVPTVDTLRCGSGSAADGARIGAQAEIEVPVACGRVLVWFDDEHRLEIDLDGTAGSLTVDRRRASPDPYAHRSVMTATEAFDPASGRPAARIILDGSVVEVFSSAGRVISTRVYPGQATGWHVEAPAAARYWRLAP